MEAVYLVTVRPTKKVLRANSLATQPSCDAFLYPGEYFRSFNMVIPVPLLVQFFFSALSLCVLFVLFSLGWNDFSRRRKRKQGRWTSRLYKLRQALMGASILICSLLLAATSWNMLAKPPISAVVCRHWAQVIFISLGMALFFLYSFLYARLHTVAFFKPIWDNEGCILRFVNFVMLACLASYGIAPIVAAFVSEGQVHALSHIQVCVIAPVHWMVFPLFCFDFLFGMGLVGAFYFQVNRVSKLSPNENRDAFEHQLRRSLAAGLATFLATSLTILMFNFLSTKWVAAYIMVSFLCVINSFLSLVCTLKSSPSNDTPDTPEMPATISSRKVSIRTPDDVVNFSLHNLPHNTPPRDVRDVENPAGPPAAAQYPAAQCPALPAVTPPARAFRVSTRCSSSQNQVRAIASSSQQQPAQTWLALKLRVFDLTRVSEGSEHKTKVNSDDVSSVRRAGSRRSTNSKSHTTSVPSTALGPPAHLPGDDSKSLSLLVDDSKIIAAGDTEEGQVVTIKPKTKRRREDVKKVDGASVVIPPGDAKAAQHALRFWGNNEGIPANWRREVEKVEMYEAETHGDLQRVLAAQGKRQLQRQPPTTNTVHATSNTMDHATNSTIHHRLENTPSLSALFNPSKRRSQRQGRGGPVLIRQGRPGGQGRQGKEGKERQDSRHKSAAREEGHIPASLSSLASAIRQPGQGLSGLSRSASASRISISSKVSSSLSRDESDSAVVAAESTTRDWSPAGQRRLMTDELPMVEFELSSDSFNLVATFLKAFPAMASAVANLLKVVEETNSDLGGWKHYQVAYHVFLYLIS
eukprot:g20555.t1